MFESLGFDALTPRAASLILALIIGVLFGFLAERTKFCFRRSIVGEDKREAAGIWMMALATAVIGTQIAVAFDLISFGEHRFHATNLPILAVALGGLLFGAGMVLTRGCISRLTVLGSGGNLRALTVLVIFAVVAHMTLKGVLAPARVAIGAVTVDAPASLAALPGGAWLWTAVIAIAALAVALTSGNRWHHLLMAVGIGLLVPAAWVGTGFILFDEFDPIAMESLSFTAPASDTLFWGIASSAIAPGFGVGLIGGTIAGAFVASLLFRTFKWQSFTSPGETGRYLSGAALMGVGGVLAGGCTIGAGLSGVPTLSLAAIIAIVSVAVGAFVTHRVLLPVVGAGAAAPTTPTQRQAV